MNIILFQSFKLAIRSKTDPVIFDTIHKAIVTISLVPTGFKLITSENSNIFHRFAK